MLFFTGNQATITDSNPARSSSSRPIDTEDITITKNPTIATSSADHEKSPAVSFEQLSLPGPSTEQESGFHQEPSGSVKRWHFDFSHPFQPKNYAFPKKKFGMQNRSFQPTWFEQFSWLHYNEQKDLVLCFICAKQNDKGSLRTETKEYSFITEGFFNW